MTRFHLFQLSALLLSAVSALAAGPGTGFTAHEWGTFTSLQGSNGQVLDGMIHSDTVLPSFVHGRGEKTPRFSALWRHDDGDDDRDNGCRPGRGSKCIDFEPVAGTALGVTQKMETPVIYFYAQQPQDVSVHVDFPSGIISQYYPSPVSFAPAIGAVRAVANGSLTWNVHVATQPLQLPVVAANSDWAPSRQVASNSISVGGENEQFIFYRGVGRFDTSMHISSDSFGTITLHNQSDEQVAQAFLLRVTETGGQIMALGSLDPHSSLSTQPDLSLLSLTGYLQRATEQLAKALQASGLYEDEAKAMVNTWKQSYFTTPGLRVLYVLPRVWTDRLLPLNMQPAPQELVRTLVGRIEVMTAQEEQELLNKISDAALQNVSFNVEPLGRFAESKLRRVLELAQEMKLGPTLTHYLESLVQTVQNT